MTTYLAGPINGCDDEQVQGWRESAARFFGGDVLDPAVRDYRGQESVNVAVLVEADLDDIEACTSLLAYCWKPSYGTAMEILYAHQQGLTVGVVVPAGQPVSPWLQYHSTFVCSDLETACTRILQEVSL